MAFNFSLSDEQLLLQETVHKLVQRHESQHSQWRQEIFQQHRYPEVLWREFADAGLMGCAIPENYGGSGMGVMAFSLALEALHSHGFGSALHLITGMDAACIAAHGNETQKSFYLPRVASGEIKLCYAHTEPDAGSNVFRTQTFAHKDGDEYVITGQKVFITGADCTDYMLLVARTARPEEAPKAGQKSYGLSLFLVPTDAPGLSCHPLPMQGIEGCRQFSLFLDQVRVPADALLGPEHRGAKIIFDSLNPERIFAAALGLGMSEFVLGRATRYARERRVFGDTPIGAYQAVSHPLAEVKLEQEAARLLTYRAAWAFDQGLPSAEVGHYANLAKLKTADMAIKAVDQAIETLGGYGFSEEYDIIPFWTAARVMKTAPISREMILNFIAEHSLGLPRSY